jgi:hypothetical protein
MALELAIITLTVLSVSLITVSYKKQKKRCNNNNFPIIVNCREYPEIRI